MNERADTFRPHRARLYGIAYRMLGSRADAEDMLQEAYLRWHRTEVERVETPEAWLTTTITRLCIDRLRAAKKEREAYSGPWLPEPVIGTVTPADREAELASDLSMAFLLVLERLGPDERAAFLLHDVFDSDYAEIAQILGRNETACRQLVSRARLRVRQDRPRFQVSEHARRRLLNRFIDAIRSGNRDELLALFAEDATWTADGGGKVAATSKPVVGGARVAKLLYGVARALQRRLGDALVFELETINGQTGIVARIAGKPFWALAVETDGLKILAGYNVLNPDKLHGLMASPADGHD